MLFSSCKFSIAAVLDSSQLLFYFIFSKQLVAAPGITVSGRELQIYILYSTPCLGLCEGFADFY
jgi:hypothetical protein